MDIKEQMNQIIAEEHAANPGLEGFQKMKKYLFLTVMLLVLASKLLLFTMTNYSFALSAIGLVLGMCIPGIFVLAVYRGPWQTAFALYLLGAQPVIDLVRFAARIPILNANGISIMAHPTILLSFIVELALAVVILGTALWLTVPARSRRLGAAAYSMGRRLNAFIKANQPAQGQGPGRL